MSEIIPTILTKDLIEFQEKIKRVEGIVSRIQIDVIDGIFATNKTVDLGLLRNLEHQLRLDIHLMVKEPIDWVAKSREVLADRIVAQVEMMSNVKLFLEEVVTSGIEVGLALDLDTSVEKISPEIYQKLDLILLMAVKAGFGGQEFNSKVLEKIKKIKEMVGDLVEIGVDGGLNEKNIVECKKAGATIFYVGKTFWEAEDLRERYEELEKLVISNW